ncbi:MAG: adenine phosphoribosyltransferase [Mangrovibacterium sp.]
MDLKTYIRSIPDYPEAGVDFKDITTLLKDKDAFKETVDQISNHFANKGITKVVCLESRGFILGGAIAYHLNAGYVPVRKPGKLPAEVIKESYTLEYGTDTLEMHIDALDENDVVLIHDDLLATGGTALAALHLVEKIKVKKVYFSFISDLTFLQTPNKEKLKKYEIHSLIDF